MSKAHFVDGELPDVLAAIAHATSVATALKLAAQFGGTELYVPIEPKEADAISACVGLEDARSIARLYGGGRVDIPIGLMARKAVRDRAIRKLAAEGKSAPEIARMFGMTTRSIRRIKNARRGAWH